MLHLLQLNQMSDLLAEAYSALCHFPNLNSYDNSK